MFKEKIKYLLKSLPKPLNRILVGSWRMLNRKILSPTKIYIFNKKNISRILRQECLRLELGSREKKEGWVVIDMAEGADLRLDLIRPLPFPDDSIAEIHSEHFFEHLTINEIKFCLKECYKILKIGGEISFGVPDFNRACRIYFLDKEEFYKQKFWMSPSPNWCRSKMDELDFLIYAGGYHKFMFDKENGIYRLEEAGFENCHVREYDSTKDSEHRKKQSLYFVGEKVKE